jgi:hypothetical protein
MKTQEGSLDSIDSFKAINLQPVTSRVETSDFNPLMNIREKSSEKNNSVQSIRDQQSNLAHKYKRNKIPRIPNAVLNKSGGK